MERNCKKDKVRVKYKKQRRQRTEGVWSHVGGVVYIKGDRCFAEDNKGGQSMRTDM